jgi:hypothetical protein
MNIIPGEQIMPGLDGTGPMGMGPMTGGMRGWCSGFMPASWSYGRWPGRWAMYGRPFGFPRALPYAAPAWGWPRFAPWQATAPCAPWGSQPYGMSADDEKSYLEEQAKTLEEQLKQIQDRLSELASSE